MKKETFERLEDFEKELRALRGDRVFYTTTLTQRDAVKYDGPRAYSAKEITAMLTLSCASEDSKTQLFFHTTVKTELVSDAEELKKLQAAAAEEVEKVKHDLQDRCPAVVITQGTVELVG